MTTVITPSILAENVDQYKEQIERITGFAERAHVDISDGQFAPNLTVGLRDLWAPEGWQIDIHAMVKNVDEYIEDLVALRPNMILLHAESDGDILGALQKIKQADIKAGLVLMRPTVPSTVVDLIKAADHAMIFSGELGRFGGSASLMQLEKIRLIKDINPAVETVALCQTTPMAWRTAASMFWWLVVPSKNRQILEKPIKTFKMKLTKRACWASAAKRHV